MSRISKVDLVDGARDYRLMNRKFVNAILSMQEYNRFSKGLFGWVGFRTKWLEYENVERVAGETKWSFFKLFLYAIDGIVAFSTFPLIISAVIGVLASTLSLGYLSYVLVKKILFGDPVQAGPPAYQLISSSAASCFSSWASSASTCPRSILKSSAAPSTLPAKRISTTPSSVSEAESPGGTDRLLGEKHEH